ncbi:MAG: hypothetical protein V1874_02805 [Spirochaetota bacterium]
MKNYFKYFGTIAIITIIFLLPGCWFSNDGGSDSDVFGVVPVVQPVKISIDWETDSEGGNYWEGKANIDLLLKCGETGDINPQMYTLVGSTGGGVQYECNAYVEPPDQVGNINAPSFTVSVTSGSFIYGTYSFTIASYDAVFSFDLFDENGKYYSTETPDELIFVLNDIIFELSKEDGYTQIIIGETIAGTTYSATAEFTK